MGVLYARWTARLQLHSINNELQEESVAVLRNQGLARDARMIEVTLRDNTIRIRLGREDRLCKSVLLDEFLLNDPEDLSPNFADSMDAPVAWLIERLVSRRVDGRVLQRNRQQRLVHAMHHRNTTGMSFDTHGRVGVVTDTANLVSGP